LRHKGKGGGGQRALGARLSLSPSRVKRGSKREENKCHNLREGRKERKNSTKMMALSSRLRPLLLAAVAALLLAALAPRALAANTLMAVDLGGEFMKVREREKFSFRFCF